MSQLLRRRSKSRSGEGLGGNGKGGKSTSSTKIIVFTTAASSLPQHGGTHHGCDVANVVLLLYETGEKQ